MAALHLNDKDTINVGTTEAGLGSPKVFDESISNVPAKYRGTDADRRDMTVLGKKQVLRRNFSFITMLGFACTCVASWEGILTYLYFPLVDGGTPLLFWGFIVCAIGQTLVYASLSEMASMSPTAGGQYHWVSEFAPPKYQKVLSYYSGWLTAIGWQVYLASVCFLVGTLIQGLISLNNANYGPERWHGTLLTIAIVFFAIFFNTVLANRLPIIEGLILILHVLGFFAIVIPLWVLAPRRSTDDALFNFVNNGGWSSTGLSSMIGLLAPMAVLVGYDCAVHMGEEIKDASITLPRAIMGSLAVNATLTFVVIITICFCLGDPDAAAASITGYPFIEMIFSGTRSLAGTNVMVAIVIIMLAACGITEVAAASRQIWAFARDQGLPGHRWLMRVSPGWNIPLPAVTVSLTISALLSLINLGSSVALNAITSLGAVAVLSSYFLTIGTLVHRRATGPALPPRRWSLGRYGMAINIAALLFLAPLIFFLTWPLASPVTAEGMNWSSVMLVGTLLIATVYYFVQARHEYVGPSTVMKREYE